MDAAIEPTEHPAAAVEPDEERIRAALAGRQDADRQLTSGPRDDAVLFAMHRRAERQLGCGGRLVEAHLPPCGRVALSERRHRGRRLFEHLQELLGLRM